MKPTKGKGKEFEGSQQRANESYLDAKNDKTSEKMAGSVTYRHAESRDAQSPLNSLLKTS